MGHKPVAKGSAYESYLSGEDKDDPVQRVTQRLLRIGTTATGGMVLRGWNSDPPLADAVASLAAIALERARSIAKENQAETERNIERLRTAVLDGLAHSYKTPLTAIQTASSGLLAIRHMTPTQAELVSIIDDQAMVLSLLTTRLLQTAALEGKQVRLKRRSVQVASLIHDAIQSQDQTLESRIAVRLPDNLRPITVNSDLIRLALMQLVDNAAKYSTVDCVIEVTVHQDQSETVISVANEGTPIPPEERLRLFHRFYRGLGSARGPTGTGLGLSIVKKSAEAMLRRTWVDFENGRNRFSIAIPHSEGTIDG